MAAAVGADELLLTQWQQQRPQVRVGLVSGARSGVEVNLDEVPFLPGVELEEKKGAKADGWKLQTHVSSQGRQGGVVAGHLNEAQLRLTRRPLLHVPADLVRQVSCAFLAIGVLHRA